VAQKISLFINVCGLRGLPIHLPEIYVRINSDYSIALHLP